MGNVVTHVYYTKSNYDRLRNNKALGFRKSDNKNKNKKSKNAPDPIEVKYFLISGVAGIHGPGAIGGYSLVSCLSNW